MKNLTERAAVFLAWKLEKFHEINIQNIQDGDVFDTRTKTKDNQNQTNHTREMMVLLYCAYDNIKLKWYGLTMVAVFILDLINRQDI